MKKWERRGETEDVETMAKDLTALMSIRTKQVRPEQKQVSQVREGPDIRVHKPSNMTR